MDASNPLKRGGDPLSQTGISKTKTTSLRFLNNLSFDDTVLNADLLEVLDGVPLDLTPGNRGGFETLLLQIVYGCDQLDSKRFKKPKDFHSFFHQHQDELEPLLIGCWNSKSFGKIRRILDFQKASWDAPSRRAPYMATAAMSKAVELAWKTEYSGNNHQLLWNSINDMDREGVYSAMVSIIQSSGTGKSRMVHEYAGLSFTLPFNLRDPKDPKGLVYPSPDLRVREHLIMYPTSLRTSYQVQMYYSMFLAELFKSTKEMLDNTQRGKPFSRHSELAAWWRRHLETEEPKAPDAVELPVAAKETLMRQATYRDSLYGSVCDKVNIDTFERRRQEVIKLLKHNESNFSPDESDVFLDFVKDAMSSLNALVDTIENLVQVSDTKVKLSMYFDEAEAFTSSESKPDTGKDLYDMLRCSLCELHNHPLFVIFLSTTWSPSALAPTKEMAASARAHMDNSALQAPITETPFDCAPDFKFVPGEMTLDDINKIEFMAQFGRPLYWALYKSSRELDNKQHDVELLKFLRSKLLYNEKLDTPLNELSKEGRAAVVDARLIFDFEPRREAAWKREEKLVANHMRIAYSVPKTRGYMRSGYPSEPLLAEAAAQQMWEFRRQDPDGIVDILVDNMKSGLLDRGERDELTMRHLISEAYDRAIQKEAEHAGTSPDKPPFFSQGCEVESFIQELYQPEYAEMILDSVPDTVTPGKTLRQAFKGAKIRCTHYARLADNHGFTPEALLGAFVRGMAFVCRVGEHLVDIIYPVWLSEVTGKLDAQSMTALFDQGKRRLVKSSRNSVEIDERSLKFFPSDPEDLRPYITMVMELGVQPPPPAEAKTNVGFKKEREKMKKPRKGKGKQKSKTTLESKKGEKSQISKSVRITPPSGRTVEPVTPSTAKVGQPRKTHHPKILHPRYSIFAYGCSNTVYKVIDQSQRAKYAFLLGHEDFLAEHPRIKMVPAVRKLKPFWTAGLDCWEWMENATVRAWQEPTHKEGVSTGWGDIANEDEQTEDTGKWDTDGNETGMDEDEAEADGGGAAGFENMEED